MRYLNDRDICLNLRNGRSVEQFLSKSVYETFPTIRFIRLDKERSGEISVALFEVYDEGNKDFLDVYEFPPIDPDEPDGQIITFSKPEEAVFYACNILGADIKKFVNDGLIQDEYKDLLDAE
jgi:hypothetical protein